jgi:serine/threonine protein kinase
MDTMENDVEIELPDGKEEISLGSGVIKGIIGSGGMARVYKIWNQKLEIYRAVKILKTIRNKSLQDRFETEVKITAKLHHPNIIEIHNVGEWQGMPFLEMEFIDGESIEEVIRKHGALPPVVCSSIAILMVRGIEYAHEQKIMLYGKTYNGVIHRDLKPANIMLTKGGNIKIMDFGIARPTETSLHTLEHNNLVGTAQYLSPEQIDGMPVDSRTDIYALGANLYEMMTGLKTFPQETMTDLMRKKLSGTYRKFDELGMNIPKSLAAITRKCLNTKKTERYESAKELLTALGESHRILTGKTPEEVLTEWLNNPTGFSKEDRVSKKKAPTVLIILGIAAGAIVLGAIPFFRIEKGGNNISVPQLNESQIVKHEAQNVERLKPPVNDLGELKKGTNISNVKVEPAATVAIPREVKLITEEKVRGKPKAAVKEKEIISIDNLTQGKAAFNVNSYGMAISYLEKVPKNDDRFNEALIMLVDSYTEIGNLQNAHTLIQNNPMEDAMFTFVQGKLLLKEEKYSVAIELFQEAITIRSGLKSPIEVRKEALYYTAVAYKKILINNPSSDNKEICKKSWTIVKNLYQNTPNNKRYELAVLELENLD